MENDHEICVVDVVHYDKPSFERFGDENEIKFKFYDIKLSEDTAELSGCILNDDILSR
ncbi:MAG: hypothetical protein MJ065_00500 [Oscillospiraceae bacterium]|nr:hypothetical protein [Oscillospiraceae bacterium]